MAESKDEKKSESQSTPKVDKEQAVRDAHYFEDGVDANGKAPQASEESDDSSEG